ncbi:MAG: cytochrome c1 [Gammaproteobacteria bacterium]|nr:cytochrome c1 [Pseudomonadota bacterium]MCH9662477.1 cytochrome c1 [Gammaproteobacteria bacterium]
MPLKIRSFSCAFALVIAVVLSPSSVEAAQTAIPLKRANINLNDLASLQRGARHYVNYCLGCHALGHLRYSRIASDLEIPIDLAEQNLIFVTGKNLDVVRAGQALTISMDPDYASAAFGNVPPDLSLTGRSRGGDWIYTYLLSFYLDDSRPYGVNNLLFPDVGMPHVLWEQQGWQELDGEAKQVGGAPALRLAQPGQMSADEFMIFSRDIAAFLVYASEPIQMRRSSYGGWVIFFMLTLTLLLWFLKREYWLDIDKKGH